MNDRLFQTFAGEIDRVADRFESDWRHGRRPRVCDYLSMAPPAARVPLLRELVLLDGEYRAAAAGERPELATYLEEFPELRPVEPELAEQWRFAESRRLAAAESGGVPAAAGESARYDDPGPDDGPVAPQRIGKYLVLEELDGGGQARVFRAVHPTLGEVVVKLARARSPSGEGSAGDGPPDDGPARDLKEEARALSQVRHPNVGRVLDVGAHEGRPFLAMEYVRGRNLRQYAQAHPLPPRRAAELIAPVARALAAVHRAGVLHLDVKPANIIVDESDRPRLIDFGLARVCGAWRDERMPRGLLGGTLPFMPREQAWCETGRVNARSDVFSLGATLYFLLTGAAPYQGESIDHLLAQARRGSVDMGPLAGAPARLRAVCARAMAREPEGRYPDADAMAADLERFLRRQDLPGRAARLAAALAVAGAAAVGAWALTRPGKSPAPTPPPGADERAITSPLSVKVERGERTFDLRNAGAVHNGEHVLAGAVVAWGFYGTLLLCRSDGEVAVLDRIRPDEPRRALEVPADTSAVRGETGTEVLLACARRGVPVGRAEVEAAMPRQGPWPVLRDGTILFLDHGEVRPLGQGRDIDGEDAERAVRQRMVLLGKGLREAQAAVEAVAFPHEPEHGQQPR